VIQGKSTPDGLSEIQQSMILNHMLHFLENHDEQRLASPEFAGTPEKENLDGRFHNNKLSSHYDLFWAGSVKLE
jgi:hypothetical protein